MIPPFTLTLASLASAKDLAGQKHARSVLPGTDVERAPVGLMQRAESVWRACGETMRKMQRFAKPPSLFQHQL